MKLGIIIQARMNSKRLPGKVLKSFKGISPLLLLCDKLNKINLLNSAILATTNLKSDNKIVDFCKKKKIKYFRGSNNYVLKRYYDCAKKFKIKNIVRLTADCPFLDLVLLKYMIHIFFKKKLNYLSNTYPLPCKYPDGSDIEIFSFKILKKTFESAILPSEKEHVTNLMYKNKSKKVMRIDNKLDISSYRYTIDNKDDYKIFKFLIKNFDYNKILNFKTKEMVKFLKNHKELTSYQKNLKRNYGWESSFRKDKKFKRISN